MSRTYKDMPLRIHGKRRKEIDARRLARVVIALAQAEAETAAEVTQGGAADARRQGRRATPATPERQRPDARDAP